MRSVWGKGLGLGCEEERERENKQVRFVGRVAVGRAREKPEGKKGGRRVRLREVLGGGTHRMECLMDTRLELGESAKLILWVLGSWGGLSLT